MDSTESKFVTLVDTGLSGTAKNIGTGASIGATVGSAVPVVGTAIGAGVGAATGAVASLFGNKSKCTASKKAKRQEIEDAIRNYLTPAEMRRLVSGMEKRVPPNPRDMAYFYMGEDDCFHKNVGSRHQRFLNELPELIAQKAKEAAQQQSAKTAPKTAISTDVLAAEDVSKQKLLLVGSGSLLLIGLTALALRNKD